MLTQIDFGEAPTPKEPGEPIVAYLLADTLCHQVPSLLAIPGVLNCRVFDASLSIKCRAISGLSHSKNRTATGEKQLNGLFQFSVEF
jgi:hypothetical protein